MTLPLVTPTPASALVDTKTGRFAQVMSDWMRSVTDRMNGNASTLGAFGTAAQKDIGTSGGTVPLLNTRNAWSKAQGFPQVTLADASAWDLDEAQSAFLSLTASATLLNPTNMRDGYTYILMVQPNTYTLAFDTAYKFPGGTAPTLSTGVDAVDILTFMARGTYMYGVATKNF